ncbi:Ktr system potassium transporter B [Domibacillus antri]|uniref:Ktr system potassium transporter B n=1 Tax=Domibacillus antri TaxID=1714264 RepID=A0A1Q8Q744_9BACI|nr:TrkH family potassium uptake protein [Domibacillus antri]OLN23164.1 Ktr system potassium transporter B [Domibacillus antri]
MKKMRLEPAAFLLLLYLSAILVGTVLLKLPVSETAPLSWVDALFTATSAFTVTGLAVVDTGTEFTIYGELVILLLIQMGGLGIMSFAVIIFVLLGKRIGIKQRLIMQQALGQIHFGGVVKLVRNLLFFSLAIELIAACFMALIWVPEYGFMKGMYYSIFHAVSAFNNAGFGLWPDNMMQYAGSGIITIGITSLIILGGLGFTVLIDVYEHRSFRKFSLHTKIMVTATVALNVFAFFMFFVLEHSNTGTIGGKPLSEQLWASWFQGVTTRTAGFNSVDIGALGSATAFFMMMLMFIGAGSGSTAGGIKLTTFIVMGAAMISYVQGKKDIHLFRRTIRPEYVIRVLSITMIAFFTVIAGTFALNVTEDKPFLSLMFEAVSAFATVGLSMNLTPTLSDPGKLILVILMITGKVGPLSIAYMLAKKHEPHIKYPSEDVLTG